MNQLILNGSISYAVLESLIHSSEMVHLKWFYLSYVALESLTHSNE